MCLLHGVKERAQCAELTYNSCANGTVTRLGGMCLLLAQQGHSASVAGEEEAALSAIICLASFWFPSPEIGPPHKKEKSGLSVL